eukprot:GHVO01009305.1.p1 GENE.GHVO01009305.1~~GHVO01009305.1.p1  ORF type:complete len:439 (-),score=54.76 GHVO01009305.1:114-1430(-)
MLVRIVQYLGHKTLPLLTTAIISIVGTCCMLVLFYRMTAAMWWWTALSGPLALGTIGALLLVGAFQHQRLLAVEKTVSSLLFVVGGLLIVFSLYHILNLWGKKERIVSIVGIKAATECFWSLPDLITVSVSCSLLISLSVVVGINGLLTILASSTASPVSLSDGTFDITEASGNDWRYVHSFLWILLWIWICSFIMHMSQLITTFLATLWYFSMPDLQERREDLPPFFQIFRQIFRFHIGTAVISSAVQTPLRCFAFVSKYACMFTRSFTLLPLLAWWDPCRTVVGIAEALNSCAYVECVLKSTGYFKSCRIATRKVSWDLRAIREAQGCTRRTVKIVSTVLAVVVGAIVQAVYKSDQVPSGAILDWQYGSRAALALTCGCVSYLVSYLILSCLDQIIDVLVYCFAIEASSPFGIVFSPESIHMLIEQCESGALAHVN